jgi:hypothetical protein
LFVKKNKFKNSKNIKNKMAEDSLLEKKWLELLDSQTQTTAEISEMKLLARQGIPHSLRGRAWQALSGENSPAIQLPFLFSGVCFITVIVLWKARTN